MAAVLSTQKSEQIPTSFLDILPVRLCLIDADGAVREMNAAWRSFFGPNSLLGAHPHPGRNLVALCQSLGPSGRLLAAGVEDVLNGKAPSFSHQYATPEGGERRRYCISVTAVPESFGGGAVIAHLDGADGRRPGPAARRTEEQLLHMQKMEAVGRLAGGVAHDFNNLLTLISGYAEILLKRMPAGDPDHAEVEEIRKAANRGAGLTNQLLAFSRREPVEPQIVDLNQLVADMERMLRRMIGEDVHLVAELASGLGKIRADPGQLGQVIMNLVLNARDAMPRGGNIFIETANVEVAESGVKSHCDLDSGSYVMLAVEDTGHGMDGDTLSHLFEPFFTRGKERGTGLGLSTVYRIVKQSHGDIWAESRLGEGSRFTLYLPRVSDEATEPGETNGLGAPSPVGTEAILLVEDEASVRRLLKHILDKQGYTVMEAASGEEALEMYDRERVKPHLLLTDMVMPHMNGRELADALTTRQPGLKVLYVSGYTDDVLVRSGALGPGMAFLQKPLKPQVLIAKVREVLDAPAGAPAVN